MPTSPLPDDEDAAADALAAELEARAMRDPDLCRAILRRLKADDPEAFKPAAECSLDELAKRHGTDRFALYRLTEKTLRKLRYTPEVRTIKP